jgi:hypothetical protein
MHIYNWHHSSITGIHYVHEYRPQYTWRNPLVFLSPLLNPLCSPFESPLLTWNLPCCDRIRPPWSQVACKLTSPYSTLSPTPTPLQNPRTQASKRRTMPTLRIRLLLSGTVISLLVSYESAISQFTLIPIVETLSKSLLLTAS